MTGAALQPVCTPVHIVALVTLATLLTAVLEMRQRLRMAALASQPLVGTGQRKLRLFVMIETPAGPGRRMMATAAILAQAALVRIIRTVTIHAGRHGAGKLHIFVATFASGGGMPAQQREVRQLMIELYVLVPAGFGMTLLALPAQ